MARGRGPALPQLQGDVVGRNVDAIMVGAKLDEFAHGSAGDSDCESVARPQLVVSTGDANRVCPDCARR